MDDLVVVIPARGGSKRIKGKNIRPLAGKPLVHHAIEYAKELESKTIIVSTDSDEVAGVVRTRYPDVRIDFTFTHTDETTVDDVTAWYWTKELEGTADILVVIQPTMIGENVVNSVGHLLTYLRDGNYWIRWSGLRAVSGSFMGWFDLPLPHDMIDIDTMSDFAAAEALLRKSTTIGIYYKAGEKQGWGHELRAKTLADALQDYDVTLVDAADAFQYPYPPPDVVIMDVGDTKPYQLSHGLLAEGSKVITIEDNGPGARFAHATINPFTDLKYAVLRPEFYNLPEYEVHDTVLWIHDSFGGQDNHHMGKWVGDILDEMEWGVQGPKITMAASMLKADIFICAGGQTSVEAIKVGVPTIVIPAHTTEAMRPHLGPHNGIINLGIVPTKDALKQAVKRLVKDKMLREDMSRRMKAVRVGDGTVEIRRIIEDLCQR